MTTLPTWRTPYASSRGGTPIQQGGGFTWGSMVRRGLGQDPTAPAWYNDPTINPGAATTSGIPWGNIFSNLTSAGIQIGKQFASYANPIYNLAPGTYYQQTPSGTTVSTAGIPGSVASLTSSNMMPILLIGGGLLLVMMMAKR